MLSREVAVVERGDPIPLRLQVHEPDRLGSREVGEAGGVSEDERQLSVGDHEGQAVGRQGRVERHVATARLPDPQQCRQPREPGLHADAHQHLGPHAQLAQPAADLAGVPVQVGVAQLGALVLGGHAVRGAGHLGREALVRAHRRDLAVGVVPRHQLGVPLGLGQQRQLGQPGRRVGHRPAQQHLQVAQQPFDRGRVEQPGLVRALEPQPVRARLGQEVEVELGHVDAHHQVGERELDPGRGDRGRLALGVAEQDLEQRRATGVPLHPQGLDQLAERQVLVRVGGHGGVPEPGQQVGERRVAGQVAADRERGDEEADQPGQLGPGPVGADGADGDVGLPGVAVQQGLEAGHQRDEQGGALAAAQLAQSVEQGPVGHPPGQPAVELLHHGARVVGGELKGLRPVQGGPPVAGQLVEDRPAEPVALPDGVVGELHRQGGQLGRGVVRCSHRPGVVRRQFAQQQPGRPAVGHRVVGHHEEHVLGGVGNRRPRQRRRIRHWLGGVGNRRPRQRRRSRCWGGQPDQPGPQQGPRGQRERAHGLDVNQVAQQFRLHLGRVAGQVHQVGRHRPRGVDDLDGPVARPGRQAGAQRLVAGDDLGQRAVQGGRVQGPGQPQGLRHVVGGLATLCLAARGLAAG